MVWQLTGLAFFSLTLLPLGAALVAGHVPDRLRHRLPADARPLGWALLSLYAVAPLNALPRLCQAPPSITLAATAIAAVVAVAGSTYLAFTTGRARKVAP
ncbi:hypothetical protein [Streptomyces sp. NPDC096132]|uniref:hypothetical protein n=1 Tax=Streptomyces sp. NPDC096132 TaxID=3366075 RepID=UPI003809D176